MICLSDVMTARVLRLFWHITRRHNNLEKKKNIIQEESSVKKKKGKPPQSRIDLTKNTLSDSMKRISHLAKIVTVGGGWLPKRSGSQRITYEMTQWLKTKLWFVYNHLSSIKSKIENFSPCQSYILDVCNYMILL